MFVMHKVNIHEVDAIALDWLVAQQKGVELLDGWLAPYYIPKGKRNPYAYSPVRDHDLMVEILYQEIDRIERVFTPDLGFIWLATYRGNTEITASGETIHTAVARCYLLGSRHAAGLDEYVEAPVVKVKELGNGWYNMQFIEDV